MLLVKNHRLGVPDALPPWWEVWTPSNSTPVVIEYEHRVVGRRCAFREVLEGVPFRVVDYALPIRHDVGGGGRLLDTHATGKEDVGLFAADLVEFIPEPLASLNRVRIDYRQRRGLRSSSRGRARPRNSSQRVFSEMENTNARMAA